MKQLFKGQISCKAVFSKQARDSYYQGILAATELAEVTIFFKIFTIKVDGETTQGCSTNKKMRL